MGFIFTVLVFCLLWRIFDKWKLKKWNWNHDRLNKCPDCIEEISGSARTCPHCGAITPQGQYHRNGVVRLIIVIGLLLLVFAPWVLLKIQIG